MDNSSDSLQSLRSSNALGESLGRGLVTLTVVVYESVALLRAIHRWWLRAHVEFWGEAPKHSRIRLTVCPYLCVLRRSRSADIQFRPELRCGRRGRCPVLVPRTPPEPGFGANTGGERRCVSERTKRGSDLHSRSRRPASEPSHSEQCVF